MIHLALLILAAGIVIPVVFMALTGTLYLLFADGRWVYTLMVVGMAIFWAVNMFDKQNAEAEANRERNLPLQNQCIEQTQAKAYELRQTAINRGEYTSSYSQQLANAYNTAVNNCKIRYPAT